MFLKFHSGSFGRTDCRVARVGAALLLALGSSGEGEEWLEMAHLLESGNEFSQAQK